MLAVVGDRIQTIRVRQKGARTRVDATNLVAARGFTDLLGQSEFNAGCTEDLVAPSYLSMHNPLAIRWLVGGVP